MTPAVRVLSSPERSLCSEGRGVHAKTQKEEEVGFLESLSMRTYVAVLGLRDSLNELRTREEGQALVEYALLLALIAVVSIAVLTVLGTRVSHIFSRISNSL